MMGWPVAWKCFVACLPLDESQQPTWPHVRQSRRCTQLCPLARHSAQPTEVGVTGWICLMCGQVCRAMAVLLLAKSRSALVGATVGTSHISFRYSCTTWA